MWQLLLDAETDILAPARLKAMWLPGRTETVIGNRRTQVGEGRCSQRESAIPAIWRARYPRRLIHKNTGEIKALRTTTQRELDPTLE